MNTMNMMEHKGNVLIPTIAYGDAAGLPVETRTAEYIEQKYGIIHSLLPTKENPFFTGENEPGTWSDDTQLTLAVAKALIKADGFDIHAMADAHLDAYGSTKEIFRKGKWAKRGWGGSTIDAMEKIKSGVSPLESGTLDGSGNGVLMKLAPLAYWQTVREVSDEERHEQYDALTNMTHDSLIARLTTRVHGDTLTYLMKNGYEREAFLDELASSVAQHEGATWSNGEAREILSYLPEVQTRNDILNRTDAKGFYAPQTLAMAYGAFVLNEARTTDSMYEAVNLGGDTDSTASIVGAMSALASREVVLIPIDHQQLDQLEMLKRTSRELAQYALRSVETTR